MQQTPPKCIYSTSTSKPARKHRISSIPLTIKQIPNTQTNSQTPKSAPPASQAQSPIQNKPIPQTLHNAIYQNKYHNRDYPSNTKYRNPSASITTINPTTKITNKPNPFNTKPNQLNPTQATKIHEIQAKIELTPNKEPKHPRQ